MRPRKCTTCSPAGWVHANYDARKTGIPGVRTAQGRQTRCAHSLNCLSCAMLRCATLRVATYCCALLRAATCSLCTLSHAAAAAWYSGNLKPAGDWREACSALPAKEGPFLGVRRHLCGGGALLARLHPGQHCQHSKPWVFKHPTYVVSVPAQLAAQQFHCHPPQPPLAPFCATGCSGTVPPSCCLCPATAALTSPPAPCAQPSWHCQLATHHHRVPLRVGVHVKRGSWPAGRRCEINGARGSYMRARRQARCAVLCCSSNLLLA